MAKRYIVEHRALVERNTDPLRRCYDGVHFSSEWRWTNWSVLETNMPVTRIDFWIELNDYAVSQRGKSARKQFRLVENTHE